MSPAGLREWGWSGESGVVRLRCVASAGLRTPDPRIWAFNPPRRWRAYSGPAGSAGGLSNRLDCLHIQLRRGGEGFIIYCKQTLQLQNLILNEFVFFPWILHLLRFCLNTHSTVERSLCGLALRPCSKLLPFITSWWPFSFLSFCVFSLKEVWGLPASCVRDAQRSENKDPRRSSRQGCQVGLEKTSFGRVVENWAAFHNIWRVFRKA